ncbi:MAG: MFS transporter [Spirochaetes bacterium]|jgi:GPH family glycoside/pentoside/hexuronide:cation symporter|nr:MFS transporter [Spirochaetota bacterium]
MEQIKGFRLFLYNVSSAGHALFDSLILAFYMNFLLPPAESIQSGQMIQYLPDTIFYIIPTIGFIMFAGRIIDAISDPLIASASDKSRSRFGRRRFFLIISVIPFTLTTALVFFPPVAGVSIINVIYLSCMFSLFFLFYTMYVAPYIALIPELANSEKDRLSITTAQGYFALIGGAIAMIGGSALIGLFRKHFSLTQSYQYMIILLSAVGFLFLLASIFAINEKRFTRSVPSSLDIFTSIKKTLSNRYFVIFLISYMAGWFVFNILRSSAIHVGETMMNLEIEESGLNFIILFVAAGFSFVLVMYLTRIFGKRRIMLLGLLLFALLSICLSATGLLPVNPNIYGKIFWGLLGFPTAIFLILPNVFIAELCDYDYKITGENREGIYFGVNGLFLKLNLGISTAAAAALYVFFGKDIANPLGIRLSLILGALVSLGGMIILVKYPKNLQKIEK